MHGSYKGFMQKNIQQILREVYGEKPSENKEEKRGEVPPNPKEGGCHEQRTNRDRCLPDRGRAD